MLSPVRNFLDAPHRGIDKFAPTFSPPRACSLAVDTRILPSPPPPSSTSHRALLVARGTASMRVITAEEEAGLERRLPALRRGRSVLSVARELGISQGVVRRARDGVRGSVPRGKPPVLGYAEEAVLVEKILYYSARGVPMTQAMLRDGVAAYVNEDLSEERRQHMRQTFVDGRPGRKWVRLFLRRHPEVSQSYGRSLQAARAAASNPENIARMMALLKRVREEKKVTAQNVFNADECGIQPVKLLNSTRRRFLGAKGSAPNNIVPTVCGDAQSFTFMPIIAADGTKLPPTIIALGTCGNIKRRRPTSPRVPRRAPAERVAGSRRKSAGSRRGTGSPRAWGAASMPAAAVGEADRSAAAGGDARGDAKSGAPRPWQYLNDVAPPNTLFMFRDPPGMNKFLFTDWCLFAADRIFKDLRPGDAKLLILDGCRVHLAFEALEALARVGVEVFLLPANTTHITQQLDVALFKPFKADFREAMFELVRTWDLANNKGARVDPWDIVSCIAKAEEKSFIPSKIKFAFETTGVEPWDPSRLETKVLVSDSDARGKKPNESLSRLAARLAPVVSKERHNLSWERGTLKTTQAVFMDEDNRKFMEAQEDEKKDAAEEKERKRAAKAEAKVQKAANQARKAEARKEREAHAAKKKEDDERRKEQAALRREAAKVAAASKKEEADKKKRLAATRRAADRAASAAVKAAAAEKRKATQAAKKAASAARKVGTKRKRGDRSPQGAPALPRAPADSPGDGLAVEAAQRAAAAVLIADGSL